MNFNLNHKHWLILYTLTTLAIALPLVGYQTILNMKAAPISPPITPPITIFPTPVLSYLKIISPVSGQIFHAGSTAIITWNSSSDISKVNISLRNNLGEILFNTLVPNNRSYTWRVPVVKPNPRNPNPTYTINLSGKSTKGNLVSTSSGFFTISSINRKPIININNSPSVIYGQSFTVPFTVTDADKDMVRLDINRKTGINMVINQNTSGYISGYLTGVVLKPTLVTLKASDDFGGSDNKVINFIQKSRILPPRPTYIY